MRPDQLSGDALLSLQNDDLSNRLAVNNELQESCCSGHPRKQGEAGKCPDLLGPFAAPVGIGPGERRNWRAESHL